MRQLIALLPAKTVVTPIDWAALDGRGQEILFRPGGVIAETEETVSIQNIPAPARAAIEKEARNRKIVKVDRLIRDSKIYYEGEYLDSGVKQKALFDGAGTRVE